MDGNMSNVGEKLLSKTMTLDTLARKLCFLFDKEENFESLPLKVQHYWKARASVAIEEGLWER